MINKISEILSLIALLSLCCGCIITNLHLASFGILDYSLFSIQMMYCGTTFIGLLVTSITFSIVATDYLQFDKMSWIDVIINGLTRGIIIGNVFIVITIISSENEALSHWLVTLSLIAMSGKFLQYSCCLDKIYTIDKVFKWINYFVSCIVALVILCNIYDNKNYYNFVAFFIYINTFLYSFRLNHSIRLFDKKRGIKLVNPDFFSTDTTINSTWSCKDNILGLFAIIFSILILISYYVANLYPFVYEKYGGGYKELLKYELKENNSLVGRTIKVTDSHIYILDGEDNIHILKIDDIVKIKK